jgi:ABC-type Fe3+ transport system substrate-binding protein
VKEPQSHWGPDGSGVGPRYVSSFGSLGLMNRAPHPNAAVVFINWLLSKEGQLVWSKAVNAVSRRVDVPTDHLPLNQSVALVR